MRGWSFLLVCLLFGVGRADEPLHLGLEQAASVALANSPRLQGALARLAIAREQTEEVAAPARPAATLEADYSAASYPQGFPYQTVIDGSLTTLRPLATGSFYRPSGRLRVRQLLNDGGRIAAQIKAARSHRDAVAQNALADWNQLYLEIRLAYADLRAAEESVAQTQSYVETTQRNVRAAESRFEAGEVAKGDIL
ncbi:MAG: TolC family protein, partial [Candidatus Eremiobacteraeota bacterium]|nr:TolC family protein [Candidatus Eremiobacteraeota bacterium]